MSTLELIWREGVYAFARSADGSLAPARLVAGARDEIDVAGKRVTARRLAPGDLLTLAESPPEPSGASARALFALAGLAGDAVRDGLVHPQLVQGGGSWYAFWGVTLDDELEAALDAVAAAAPPVAGPLDELFPRLVDEVARRRLAAAGVRLASGRTRTSAAGELLAGLAASEPELPPGRGYGALARRLERWVDAGLGTPRETRWRLGLHLDERQGEDSLVLEPWLHAQDDPTLALPVSQLHDRAAGFAFVREGDPPADLAAQLDELAPLLARHGIALDAGGGEVELGRAAAGRFLLELLPELERLDVPVLLPPAWTRAPARIRARVSVSARPASGLLSVHELAAFDWRLAVGDVELDEAGLRELAAAKSPVVRSAGRWRALDPGDVARALRFLERRQRGGGAIELVRAVAGLETDEAGLELEAAEVDARLGDLLAGADGSFRPLAAPPSMRGELYAYQERGHGWLRLLGDLGIGAILADDMGLGKTVQAIAMLLSEREQGPVGPTLVVCPLSVARQWMSELARFAPTLRAHLHHGSDRLAEQALAAAVANVDVVVTSYDVAARDVGSLARIEWDRLLLDEAQDVKNPRTRRARALRRIPARRRLALTGTPLENHLGELWALLDILNPGLLGSRERFERTFARPIEIAGDRATLERLRAVVRPFVLRRRKDAPEVGLDLPPLETTKDYCRLTTEQAALYRATVDHWLPRIEARGDRFGRRGAVLAMLAHLKQVCNHPELLVQTGGPLAGRSGKLERLVELLAAVPREDKALVFTQYPSFDRLVPHLAERLGRGVGFFHGRLDARAREEQLAAFASEGEPSLLVISLRAGGRGLNLPAANHVFHFDRWWNPAVEQQASDRVYRLGQRKPVFVHSLICLGTLEERIDTLLESKRELAEQVLAGRADDWLATLDLDEIREAVALAGEPPDVAPEPVGASG